MMKSKTKLKPRSIGMESEIVLTFTLSRNPNSPVKGDGVQGLMSGVMNVAHMAAEGWKGLGWDTSCLIQTRKKGDKI